MLRTFVPVLLVSIWLASTAWAANTSVDTRASLGAFGDSNRLLKPDNVENVTGAHEQLGVELNYREPDTRWMLGVNGSNEQLDENEQLENDEISMLGRFSLQDEVNTLVFDGSAARKSTLATEFQAGGNVEGEKDFIRGVANTSYSRALSDVISLTGNLYMESLDYQDSEATNLQEYVYSGVTLSGAWQWDERDSVELSLFYNTLDNKDDVVTNDTHGIKLAWIRELKENLELRLAAGGRWTRYEYDYGWLPEPLIRKSQGRVGEFRLKWTGERSSWLINSNYELVPSSNASLVSRQSLGSVVSCATGDVTRFEWEISLRSQRSDEPQGRDDDLDSAISVLRYHWRFSRNWYLTARYQYFYRDLVSRDEQADSHVAALDLVWATHPVWQHQ